LWPPHIKQGLPVFGNSRIKIEQSPDALRDLACDTRYDHPGITMATQDDIHQARIDDRFDNVPDVGREIDGLAA
jgi:hypothetical protein